MRRSLLRGVAALTLTGSLAIFLTGVQPTPVHAQSSGANCPVGAAPPTACSGKCNPGACASVPNGNSSFCVCK